MSKTNVREYRRHK